MPLRVIDRQLFVTDDGRMICAFRDSIFLIPETDIPLLVGVRSRLSVVAVGVPYGALAVMIVTNLNVEFSFVLWIAVAFLTSIACSQIFNVWLRDHFSALSDAGILGEVREIRGGSRAARWTLVAAGAAYPILYFSRASASRGGWYGIAVLFVTVVLVGLGSAAAKKQRDAVEGRVSSSITR